MRIDVALHRSTRMPFAPPAPRMPAPTTHRGTARPHIRQRRRTQPTMAPPDAQPPAPGERGRFQVSSRIPENHVSQWRSSAFASVAGRPRAAT
ncbi:FAD-dependent oxidoreductase domain protein [Burkholderia pseudomallei ABCPW 107]|nr:FAD-dependent oxidoreductase domain protein [Burkholderia pseudomallei ABCPW 107]